MSRDYKLQMEEEVVLANSHRWRPPLYLHFLLVFGKISRATLRRPYPSEVSKVLLPSAHGEMLSCRASCKSRTFEIDYAGNSRLEVVGRVVILRL